MRLDMPWGTLSAVDEGRGPVVVLLHSLAMSGEMWRPLIDRMRDDFRVIAPDARGHGQSTWDGEPFTVVDLAEDIAALITSLDVAPVSVLRSEEHTSELQSRENLVCRLLLEKK